MLLQKALLAASRRPGLRRAVTGNPATRRVVDRFVAGETLDDALAAVRSLRADGVQVTLDHLGEDITTRAEAVRTRDAYLALLDGLAPLGLGRAAEVSVKLSAFGQALGPDGHDLALELVRPVVEAATAMGTTVTLDMEDHTTVDSTLAALAELRKEHPGTGAVLQAMLFRTEEDAKALAVTGSRVRLVKGAYNEPATVAHQKKKDVDAAYARCLEILMAGPGYPMVGSHDPAMVAAGARAGRAALPGRRLVGGADALRHPPRRAAPPGRRRHPGARLRPLRRRLVRLLHAPAGRAPRQRRLLPALARHQVLKEVPSHGRRHPRPGPAQRAGPDLRARFGRARRAAGPAARAGRSRRWS